MVSSAGGATSSAGGATGSETGPPDTAGDAGSGIGNDARSVAVDVAAGVRITVEPQQILEAAKLVVEQADALSDALLRHGPLMRVGPPSENAVSKAVADAWNSVIVDGDESYLARVKQYLAELRQLQKQLREAAERYQLDDDEIAAAFGERRAD